MFMREAVPCSSNVVAGKEDGEISIEMDEEIDTQDEKHKRWKKGWKKGWEKKG